MAISAADSELRQIPTDRIDRNPENPRIVFRPREFQSLLESIRVHDVQVPISVYREGQRFVLIDGERRWKCCLKLNKKTIPALVQEKPKPLYNLLLMFNIHALREQWDLLTIALKLPKIISLLEKELKRNPTERELSEKTGLNRAVIRRCKLLMGLPAEYQEQILEELRKPKPEQKFTEDLFIEMERALTTVERALPGLIRNRDQVRRVLLRKYKNGTITNRVEFRNVARIARAERVGFDVDVAARELRRLFEANTYSIEEAFNNSVGEAYLERDVGVRVETLLHLLEEIDVDELDDEVKQKLRKLRKRVSEILSNAP